MAAAAFCGLSAVIPAYAASPDAARWAWSGKDWTVAGKPFDVSFDGAAPGSVVAHDLGSDGVSEIVVGAPAGHAPEVRVLRGDGSKILSFDAFDASAMGGANVAVGDLDGDGKAEIVVGSGPGIPAEVRVFDAQGHLKPIDGGLFPYGKDFTGGANVAVGDLDGDGKAEIVVGAGPGGGPHVRIFRGDGKDAGGFFAFDESATVGLHVAVGDLDGDGKAEIVTALGGDASPVVRAFDMTGAKKLEFSAKDATFTHGLSIAAADLGSDGRAEIALAPAEGAAPTIEVHAADGRTLGSFLAGDKDDKGGLLLALAPSSDGTQIVAVRADRAGLVKPELAKYIEVSVTEQRLRAYEYGKLTRTFLVATGLQRHPTPIGDFSVLQKPYKVNYTWSYGPHNPDNYELGWVTWNLLFQPHTYIHYAPWRKVFGVRGSHGCVNVDKTSAQWIYGWADVGTPVSIRQ